MASKFIWAVAGVWLAAGCAATQQQFNPALTIGPTIPVIEVTPGDTHPVSVAPGTGVSLGMDLFPGTLLGKSVHWLSVGGDFFGTLVPSGNVINGNVSIAMHASVAELVTLGLGLKLYDAAKVGLLDGVFSSRTVFILLGIDYGLLNSLILGHAGSPQPAESSAPQPQPASAPH